MWELEYLSNADFQELAGTTKPTLLGFLEAKITRISIFIFFNLLGNSYLPKTSLGLEKGSREGVKPTTQSQIMGPS